ncbi:MAG: 2-oxoacid:acceptor oxidoreductase family protein [Nitrososphaeria archaeon]|nr:2-oxoacid:acceptor oxidoreductase family protein [Nitrososphaeria archaeon]
MLYEIRFHGRGGQGAVTAAELLVKAAVCEGKWGQSFPFFGAERRGAPVTAFARISEEKHFLHSPITEPNIVVVLDRKILDIVDVKSGLKENGTLVINSSKNIPKELLQNFRTYVVDATKIAVSLELSFTGWVIVNTAMLGAIVKAVPIVTPEGIMNAIRNNWAGKVGELNAEAAKRAYEEATIL